MTVQPSRQPVFDVPVVLLALLGVLIAIQAIRDALPLQLDAEILARFAFVPGRLTYAWNPAGMLAHVKTLEGAGQQVDQQAQIAAFFLGDGAPQPWTFLTYALLHGSWTHVGLNAVWLLAFGAPVARRFGPVRFLLFFAASALAGVAAHYAVYPFDLQPLVGASASISGCMAAALRFMFHAEPADGTRIPGLLPHHSRPPLSVAGLLHDRRALSFLLVWFVTNFATGFGAQAWGLSEAPIAWQAHVGGFLFGLVAFRWFDRRQDPVAMTGPAGPDTPTDAV